MHVGIFDLEYVKVIWGHSVQFSDKMGHTSKMGNRRAKQTNIWVSGVYVAIMLVFFFTLNMSRSFGGIFQQLGSNSETAHHRVKWTKIWASGVYVARMLVFFTLNMSRSFWVIWCTCPKK